MGLNYSYMLYFKRDQLSDVLQGVIGIARPDPSPSQVCFPDHILKIPLGSYYSEAKTYQYDDPVLRFQPVLIFDEDQAILDWCDSRHKMDDSFRSPPGEDYVNQISVDGIDMNVYNDLSYDFPDITQELGDLVLFQFRAFISRISAMFLTSKSIRKKFTKLLRKYNEVCGLFDDEEKGEVFWLNGKEISGFIDDIWLSPEEIEQKLTRG